MSQTFYLLASTAGSSNPGWGDLQIGGSAPGSAAYSGWIVDTVAPTKYCLANIPNELASSGFGASTTLTASPSIGDSYRSQTAITASYASGTWALTIAMMNSVAGGQKGHLRMRAWASTNSNGTSARELTSGAVVGSTTPSMPSTFTPYDASISWSAAPSITLSSEYLFFQFEWVIDTAASSCGRYSSNLNVPRVV